MKKLIGFISLGLIIIALIVSIIVFISKDEDSKNDSKVGNFTPQITEKTTLIKVDDLEGVSLKTSKETYKNNIDKITLVFQNDTDKEYIFGESYSLEKLENNQWYILSQAPSEYERAWNDIGYILKPNSKREEEVKLQWIYGNNFESGTYRIVKDIIYSREPGDYDKFYLTAEFRIEDK